MKVVRYHKSAFERQINESVSIQNIRKNHHILNTKAEYNRCALPRLSLKIGEKEFKEKLRESEEDAKKEELIEIKIRELRKKQNKLRKDQKWGDTNQPPKKRQKMMKYPNLESDVRVQPEKITEVLIEETNIEIEVENLEVDLQCCKNPEVKNPERELLKCIVTNTEYHHTF